MLRRTPLLSPIVIFPALWLLGVALAQIHVLAIQRAWSGTAWFVAVLVPVAFVFGGLLGRRFVEWLQVKAEPRRPPVKSRRLRLILVGCLVIGYAELAHQALAGGTVPLFSGHIDNARFGQPGGPTILLLDLMTAAAVVALCRPPRLFSRDAVPELAIAGMALFAQVLQANRGQIVLPVAVAFLVRWLYWRRPRWRVVLPGALILLAVVSTLFFARTAQHRGGVFEQELYHHILPATPVPLRPFIPLHVGIATNFEALAHVVDFFPGGAPYGGGAFSAHGLDLFIPGARNLHVITGQLTPPWVTSTVAGTLWADGGPTVVAVGLALIGAIVMAMFTYARRTGAFRHYLAAGYLLYQTLFGLYENLWTQQMDWLLVTPVLILIGAVAENPLVEPPMLTAARARVAAFRSGRSFANFRAGVWESAATSVLRPPAALFAGLVIALVVVTLAVHTEAPAASSSSRPTPMVPVVVTKLPSALDPSSAAPIMSDGDIRSATADLWTVTRSHGQASLDRYELRKPVAARTRAVSLRRASSRRASAYDVARWKGARMSLFRFRDTAKGIRVRVTGPGGRRTVARGFAKIRALRGQGRDEAVATWSGNRPDLFVIDRGSATRVPRLAIFSGESGFRRRLLSTRLPLGNLDRRMWTIDVGRFTPARPDLVLVTRLGQSGHPEIHILSGESHFQRFSLHRPIALSSAVARRSRFLVAASHGVAGIDLLTPGDRNLSGTALFGAVPPSVLQR